MANRQISTHFDFKVIISFVILFLFSLSFLIVKKNLKPSCDLEDIKVEGNNHKAGQIITFSDASKTSDEWEWNFGDNESPEYRSKVNHIYKNPGEYKVRLTTGSGCYIEKRIYINPSDSGFDKNKVPTISGTKECFVGQEVTFQDLSSFSKSWEWRFGESKDGKVDSKEKVATYTFVKPGMKYGSLIVNGDATHMRKIEIFVKEVKQNKVVVNPTANVNIAKVIRPELESDEETLKKAIVGVADEKLSYVNFTKYFCVEKMPKVTLKDGSVVSLKKFDKMIRGKTIRGRKLSIVKKGDCPTSITVDYVEKGILSSRSSFD